jgi:hypothetical protein
MEGGGGGGGGGEREPALAVWVAVTLLTGLLADAQASADSDVCTCLCERRGGSCATDPGALLFSGLYTNTYKQTLCADQSRMGVMRDSSRPMKRGRNAGLSNAKKSNCRRFSSASRVPYHWKCRIARCSAEVCQKMVALFALSDCQCPRISRA